MLASPSGYVEVVRLLLKAGCDKDLADSSGNSALASGEGFKVEVVCLLLEAGADNSRSTALMLASQRGNVGVVRLLMEGGATESSTSKRRHGFSDGIPKKRA